MKTRLLQTLGVVCVLALAASYAGAVGLTFTPTPLGFQQTTNNPCVIGDPSCQEPTNFFYNKESGQPAGQTGTYDLQSAVYVAGSSPYNHDVIPTSFTFGVDENIAKGAGSENLVFFKTWICSGPVSTADTTATGAPSGCSLDAANSYIPGSATAIPNENNGNGFSDFTLGTVNLVSGDFYVFEASVSNDTDGMEEFFIIPIGTQPVPEPGTLALFGSGLVGLGMAIRKRLAR